MKNLFNSPLLYSLLLQACYMESTTHSSNKDPWEVDSSYEDFEMASTEECEYLLFPSPTRPDCHPVFDYPEPQRHVNDVPLFLHYMLEQSFETPTPLRVEVFNNPYFNGYPVKHLILTDFDAKLGSWQRTEISLPAGEFFIRAYFSNQKTIQSPDSFGDMINIDQTPNGVYGALSSPKKIVVTDDQTPDPVHIFLNHLYVKEGSLPKTNAHLRLRLNVIDGETAEDRRWIHIELRSDDDFSRSALISKRFPSETLLIENRQGSAEFILENLPIGNYTVMVYIDNDENGFYDENELLATYQKNQQIGLVETRADSTKSITLTLDRLPLPQASH